MTTPLYPTLAEERQRFDQVRALIQQRLDAAHLSRDQRRALLIEQRSFLWENYYENAKEMDLHELALKELKTHYDLNHRQIRALARLYDHPYFARIDFQADDEDAVEPIYIGLSGLYDPDAFQAYVYDWRSPAASMYYDFECGRAFYRCPAGRIEGDLTLKRQYTVEQGQLTAMADTSLAIGDSLLVQVLSQGADTAMHQIVATIQREQNAVVRSEDAPVLIVSGVAGSGKTSVALHRAAYLLYRRAEGLDSASVIILSPNRLFADYISQVLPQLGEEQIWQTTFHDFAVAMLDKKLSVQSQQDHLEELLDGALSPARLQGIRQKNSAEFLDALDRYADALDELYDEFEDLFLGDERILRRDEMLRLYQTSRSLLRPFSRLSRIRALFDQREAELRQERIERIADRLEQESDPGTYLSRKEAVADATARHERDVAASRAKLETMLSPDCALLYRKFLQSHLRKTAGYDAGRFYSGYQRGKVDFEDVGPLLYLMLRLGKIRPVGQMRHVLVDEAQDYTLLQYRLLSLLYPNAGFTILGDPGQLLNPAMPQDGLSCARAAFPQAAEKALPRCYRLPKPISAYADRLTGQQTPRLNRPGEPVREVFCPSRAGQAQACAAFMAEHAQNGKPCAILTRTARQAYLLWQALPDPNQARLIREQDEDLGGVMVIPCYLAKGLEFDYVAAVTDGTDRAYDYVCATRAMKGLLVVHTEKPQ